VDFALVYENEWGHYGQLAAHLNGRGAPSIDEALKELFLTPVHAPFRMLVSAPAFRWLLAARVTKPKGVVDPDILLQVDQKMADILRAVKAAAPAVATQVEGDETPVVETVRAKLETILTLPVVLKKLAPAAGNTGKASTTKATVAYRAAVDYALKDWKAGAPLTWGVLFGWLFTHALGKVVGVDAASAGAADSIVSADEISRSWIDEWLLGKLIATALVEWGLEADIARRAVALVKLLIGYQRWFEDTDDPHDVLYAMLREREVQAYLGINRYEDVLWFNHEAFEQWAQWIMLLSTVDLATEAGDDFAEVFVVRYTLVRQWLKAEAASEYQVVKLLEALKPAR